MARPSLLDRHGVRDLDRISRHAYADAMALRGREPLARHLDTPKLPELLSVSLAAMAAPRLLGVTLRPGRPPHDLQTRSGVGVGVKGTGPSRWITVTASDRLVAWLIWVDYAERIRAGDAVIVLAVPGSAVLKAPARLTRAQLDRLVGRVRSCRIDPARVERFDTAPDRPHPSWSRAVSPFGDQIALSVCAAAWPRPRRSRCAYTWV